MLTSTVREDTEGDRSPSKLTTLTISPGRVSANLNHKENRKQPFVSGYLPYLLEKTPHKIHRHSIVGKLSDNRHSKFQDNWP